MHDTPTTLTEREQLICAPELALSAPPTVLDQLSALLPLGVVYVREGATTSPFVPSLVRGMLEEALCKGYVIDRSNEDGPLNEWDGWIFIIRPAGTVYIQTKWGRCAA